MDFFDVEFYNIINWFFIFSVFGYCLECVVLSFETKKIVTNRGFTKGPFCIIYGVCAVVASLTIKPIMSNPFVLFIECMIIATSAELITANIMIKLFGGFWWDYSMKPFNYKGMICLETSIGWGFVGLFFFYFFDGFIWKIVFMIPDLLAKIIALSVSVIYVVDFSVCMYRRLKGLESDTEGVGRLKVKN
ncbi:MAG: putative ABC transporter permease [Lachnospiraceae bacterium]|nr:putative ABC transporter permease [Lachnospiraceae bacterium]